MPLQKLPVQNLDDPNHRRRARETLNQVLDHSFDDSRRQTAAEKLAGKTPVNPAYEIGDIRRWGGENGADCTAAIQASIDTAGLAVIPEGFTALISDTINIATAGAEVGGKSRYTSILQVTSGFTAASMIANTLQASGTSYGASIHDIYFKPHNGTNKDVICVDLASLNNCVVRRCRFEGLSAAFASLTATGVRFSAPLASASYSNCVENCDFTYMEHGVLVASGGNHNIVRGGEFIICKWGIHADPSSVTDSLYVDGPRFEGCDIGILEGTEQPVYLRCRFENNTTADISFAVGSVDCVILGGSTAVTATPLVNMSNAAGLIVIAHDLLGLYSSSNSSARANSLIGPNVCAPEDNTGTLVVPTGIGDVAMYFRAGRAVLDNQVGLYGRDAAGTGGVEMIRINSGDRVEIDTAGNGIRLGGALTALGGGAAPTLGTIGGGGPGTAAQNSWKLLYDNAGAAFWVPVWK